MFVPLHVKSDYSFGFGTASVDELVEQAAAVGYTALALTDIETLCGQVRFHHRCRAVGLHPVTGIELRPGFDGRRNPGGCAGRMVLLAESRAGYRSLCRIVSRRRGVAGPRGIKGRLIGDPLPLVVENTEGLFVLSDDIGVLERLIASGSISPVKVKLLVVRPPGKGSADGTWQIARRLGIRMVADIDAVFLHKADHGLHLLQLAIRNRIPLAEASALPAAVGGRRYLRTPEKAAALFSDLPEALDETLAVAESCRLDLAADRRFFSAAGLASDRQAAEALRVRCGRAAAHRRAAGSAWSTVYDRRLEHELRVFERMGFAGFFENLAEILDHCRQQDIAVVARGSAVSSMTLHLLGASPVDPISQGLIFERFLNEAKSEWPDVDLDLPHHRRDEVIDWVYARFGREKVAMVAAHHRFKLRLALRETLKAFGVRPDQIDGLIRLLPPEELGTGHADFQDFSRKLRERNPIVTGASGQGRPDLAEALRLAGRLVGRPHHLAAHPGGIIIGRGPLEDLLPLERAPKGVTVTQYAMTAVAALGVVKIDLLGNRCLSELEETLRLVGGPPRLESIPSEDPAAMALIDRADTIGCFQLESPAMRSLLARLPIRKRSDIVAALALIRPGASAGAAKEAFVARARGEKPTVVFEPLLAERTAETHGLLIYEEDLMVLLSRVGGFGLARADRLRTDIVHSGGDPALLAVLEDEFLKQSWAVGVRAASDEARARRAFAAAARFAAYSFNKAHAASYGYLAYLSAYLKAHFPVAFCCALLNHHQGFYPLRTLAAEWIRSGIDIRPPHVNFSGYRSSLENRPDRPQAHGVRVGLDKIKGLSRRCTARLLETRAENGPFALLSELRERVRPTIGELKALILGGACDGLSPLSADRYPFAHEAVLEAVQHAKDFSILDRVLPPDPPKSTQETARLALYQALVRVRNELRYFEMHLSDHPAALLRPEADRYGCLLIRTAAGAEAGSLQRLLALVAAMRRVPAGGGIMQFVTLEDETGMLEAALPPAVYRHLGDRITTPGPYLIDGVSRKRQGAVHLEVSAIKPFYRRQRPFGR